MSNDKKIWLVASGGHLGATLVEHLQATEWLHVATDIEDVDITNINQVLAYADTEKPSVIINCAGLSGIDHCADYPDEAFRINAVGARNLTVAATRCDAEIIQFSTNHVFDGIAERPYHEFDVPSPPSHFGRTKWLGENFVRELSNKYYILRSSWLYGTPLVAQLQHELQTTGQIAAAEDHVGAPTSYEALWQFLQTLLDSHAYGTYHVADQGSCTLTQFLQAFCAEVGLSAADIVTLPEIETPFKGHPQNAVLDNYMMRVSRLHDMPNWQDDLIAFGHAYRAAQADTDTE